MGFDPQPTDSARADRAPSSRPRSRRLTRALAVVLVSCGVLVMVAGAAGPAGAADEVPGGSSSSTVPVPVAPSGGKTVAAVATVNGYLDPVLAAFMDRAIDDANRPTDDYTVIGLVFQVDLQGSVIPHEELGALVRKMAVSRVPVHLWIGPTGSELQGGAVALLAGAQTVAMAPGTSIGDLAPADDPRAFLGAGIAPTPLREVPFDALMGRSLDAKAAEDAKLVAFAPILGEFLLKVPGFESKQTTINGEARLEPLTSVVFTQLSLLDSFMHSAASPAVAYLMLAIGVSLLIFELFTAGVGVAGVIGAGAFVLGCYGLAVLPIRWWGVGLILVAMLAFAVDVQTGVPRVWTAVGMVAFVVGSFTIYNGVSMSWLTIGFGIVGVALTFLSGMPSMVRTRFSTPTIGREWLIGETGRAVTDITPDGVVQIKGAPWRAFTNHATPIEELDKVRVVGVEGLVLEVDPDEGAALDSPDRAPRSAGTTDPAVD